MNNRSERPQRIDTRSVGRTPGAWHAKVCSLCILCTLAPWFGACAAEPRSHTNPDGEGMAADGGLRTDATTGKAPGRDSSVGTPADAGHLDSATATAGAEQFERLRFEELTARRVVFRFDTQVPTQCEALFGTAPDALLRSARDPDMVEGEYSIDHQIPLEDLLPQTVYFARARATDEHGEVYLSDMVSFTTPMATDAGSLGTESMTDNYALLSAGTTVVAVSSNHGGSPNDGTWGANNALDGKMSTEWSSYGDGDDAFIELDFGTERRVDRMAIRSRKMTDGTSIIRSVRLTFDGSRVLGPFSMPDPDRRYVFDFGSLLATTVRIDALETSGGNTGLKEIEFFRMIPITE